MTDDFEDAIRSAGRGLSPAGEQPTYHGAWQRGRRRRVVKRSVIAAAGACALVAAFATDVGRLPGGTEIEVDDVAIEAQSVPAVVTPEFVPTAVPVPTTEPIPEPADDPTELPGSSDSSSSASAAADSAVAPTVLATVDPAPSAAAQPTAVASPTTAPTTAPTAVPTSTATPEPTVAPTSTPVPTPEPTAPAFAASQQPTTEPETTDLADTTRTDPTDPAGQTDETDPNGVDTLPDPGGVGDPQPLPSGLPADGRMLVQAVTAPGPQPCDTTGDGGPDAQCELLSAYPCKGAGDVRNGYVAIDSDVDQVVDSCVPNVVTLCDTTGDLLGDTACLITSGADG